MPEKVMPGPVEGTGGIREAVCVHTRKIYDSCRDKDCIEDLRFYPKLQYVDVINHALSVKGGSADLLYVYVDVEPVNFNRGFYTVDMRFFYNVTLQAYTSCPAPVTVEGLCVFDKRAILFGSEGSAKIFSSDTVIDELDVPGRMRTNLPTAVVEAVDPIVLDARVDDCCKPRCRECSLTEIPAFIARSFAQDLVFDDTNPRRYFVTLGQFTLVRLERETQLLIPVYDYCIPTTECSCGDQEDPCGLFRNVPFPVGEFFPPNSVETPNDYASTRSYCACRP